MVSIAVCGCSGAGNSDTSSQNSAKERTAAPEMTKVVYSAKNIEEGEIIPAEYIEERDVEAAKAPIDAFNSANAVVGQVAAYPIPAGQIVSQHSVTVLKPSVGLEELIPKDMRAITFGVDTYSDVAGFVSPECHVDIFTISDDNKHKSKRVVPLLSDVIVLATGATYQKQPGAQGANPAGSITVAVNAADSEKLIKSLANGRPFMVLKPSKHEESDADQTEDQKADETDSDSTKQGK